MASSSTEPNAPPSSKKRFIAIGALVLGLTAAWWQAPRSHGPLQVVFVLTHVSVPLGRVALTRDELVEFSVEQRAGQWLTLHFDPGAAPEASSAQTLDIDDEAQRLLVRCRFKLPSGGEVRTRGQARVPRQRSEPVVIDLGACSDQVARPR